MMKLTTAMLALAGIFTAAGVGAIERGDIERGEDLSLACMACHSTDATNNNPEWPRLYGQHSEYLLQALRDYKSGSRENAIMQMQVDHLSEQDLRDLAAYFSAGDGQLYTTRPRR